MGGAVVEEASRTAPVRVPLHGIGANETCLIDAEDADIAAQHKWYMVRAVGDRVVVSTRTDLHPVRLLHRLILDRAGIRGPRKPQDGDWLNLQKANLVPIRFGTGKTWREATPPLPAIDQNATPTGREVLVPLCGRVGQGMHIRVDECDAQAVMGLRWYLLRSTKRYRKAMYATANVKLDDGRIVAVTAHRLIMGLALGPSKVEVDHKDGDGLNNMRSNLRLATRAQNSQNVGKAHRSKLCASHPHYKGVANLDFRSSGTPIGERKIGALCGDDTNKRRWFCLDDLDRYADLRELVRAHKTLEEMSQQMGVTRERVRQLCNAYGLERRRVGALRKGSELPWGAFLRGQLIGRFATPEEAARAYNEAALATYGEFARLNEIPDTASESDADSEAAA